MRIPGLLYSILLAAAAALVEWFTSGPGQSMSYAPIIIAVIPVLLKMVTAATPETTPPAATPRAMGAPAKEAGYWQRVLLG